jgi:ribonuclease P protein component
MTPKSNRLDSKTFNEVIKKGDFTSSRYFTARSIISGERPRISVTVSKKVIALAVGRNEMRRRVYSMISPLLPTLKGSSVIVFPKKEGLIVPFNELERDLHLLMEKVGILLSVE